MYEIPVRPRGWQAGLPFLLLRSGFVWVALVWAGLSVITWARTCLTQWHKILKQVLSCLTREGWRAVSSTRRHGRSAGWKAGEAVPADGFAKGEDITEALAA